MAATAAYRRLRCFVASAFGYDDVDRVYTKLIKPALADLHIGVTRVDRVDHNDDIDNKIMELLCDADFCIADLTYARPSVYFEAGFAGATKPVIYIARKDHFRARDNDPAGNLRVHFDLQMKNIIPWGRSDATFQATLRKRVRLVTRSIVAALLAKRDRSNERDVFLALSQNQRLDALQDIALKTMSARHFIVPEDKRWHGVFRTAVVGEKNFSQAMVTVRIHVEPRFSLRSLENIGYRRGFQPFQKADKLKHSKKRHVVLSIVATPGKISRSLFDRAFPYHARLGGTAMHDAIQKEWESGKAVRSVVIPIDQVTSLKEFESQLNDAIKFACAPGIRNFDETTAQ